MSKKRGTWAESNMKLALTAVLLNDCSLREASKKFDVPKSTLGHRIKQLKSGQEINLAPYASDYERTFTESEEKLLINYIINLDSQSMPLTRKEFLKLSYQYAEHLNVKHRFNKNKQMAGKDFYYNFMKRHSYPKLKTAKSISLEYTPNFKIEDKAKANNKLKNNNEIKANNKLNDNNEAETNNKLNDNNETEANKLKDNKTVKNNNKTEDVHFLNKLSEFMKKYNLSETVLNEVINWLGFHEHSAVPTEILTGASQAENERQK